MADNTNGVTNDYKKGDFLIDFGQVFQITNLKDIKVGNDQDTLLTFSPYYKTDQEPEITSSIPQKNIEKTTIRPPMDKSTLNQTLSILSDPKIKQDKEIVDVLSAKAVLNQNNPIEVAQTIKKLYLEKSNKDIKFTGSKNYIYELLISRLAEEVALVLKTTPDKAKTKIENQLKKK